MIIGFIGTGSMVIASEKNAKKSVITETGTIYNQRVQYGISLFYNVIKILAKQSCFNKPFFIIYCMGKRTFNMAEQFAFQNKHIRITCRHFFDHGVKDFHSTTFSPVKIIFNRNGIQFFRVDTTCFQGFIDLIDQHSTVKGFGNIVNCSLLDGINCTRYGPICG